MSAIPQEVQQWLADDWNMQAYVAGLREMSIVTSTNILGRLATQQYAEKAMATPERYVLEPVYYASLEEAQHDVAGRTGVENKKNYSCLFVVLYSRLTTYLRCVCKRSTAHLTYIFTCIKLPTQP